jgi:hypothetical protein
LGLLLGRALAAPAIEPCPAERNCAEVAIEAPSRPVAPGDTVLVRVVFQQGEADAAAGGIDEIAAVTMTLGIPGLGLADCSPPGPNGLNPSFVLLPGNAGRYRVVVQNLTCAAGDGCLCPGTGETSDAYVNLLLVGTPGAGGVQALPNGELLGIALRVRPAAPGRLPLHVFSALDDPVELPRPPAAAALSIGDRQAADRTVDTDSETMNVRIADGELIIGGATPVSTATATASASAGVPALTPTAAPPSCTGDCNDSGEITVNELIAGVRIALGSLPLSTCTAFDCDGTGQVEVSCLIAGVNAALNGCPE